MLLPFAPYYALWYPGPLAKEWRKGEERPRYQHNPELLTFKARGIDLSKSEVSLTLTLTPTPTLTLILPLTLPLTLPLPLTKVLMSDICKSGDNHFTGVSFFSPKYRAKAERLLRSCARVGVCCKARCRATT